MTDAVPPDAGGDGTQPPAAGGNGTRPPVAGGERNPAPTNEPIETWPGRFYPLGASYDGAGTNFSLFSEVAEGVELCLFDDDGGEQRLREPGRGRSLLLACIPAIGDARAAVRLPGQRTVGAGQRGSAATLRSCFSILTPKPSKARSTGIRPASRTPSVTTTRATTTTAPPTCPRQWSTTRSSTGAATGPRMSR